MSRNFVEFTWTKWEDDVGRKVCDAIIGSLAEVDIKYQNYEDVAHDAERSLSTRVTYSSVEAEIRALEVGG